MFILIWYVFFCYEKIGDVIIGKYWFLMFVEENIKCIYFFLFVCFFVGIGNIILVVIVKIYVYIL